MAALSTSSRIGLVGPWAHPIVHTAKCIIINACCFLCSHGASTSTRCEEQSSELSSWVPQTGEVPLPSLGSEATDASSVPTGSLSL